MNIPGQTAEISATIKDLEDVGMVICTTSPITVLFNLLAAHLGTSCFHNHVSQFLIFQNYISPFT